MKLYKYLYSLESKEIESTLPRSKDDKLSTSNLKIEALIFTRLVLSSHSPMYSTLISRCDCPFWPDDRMCRLRDCSVCQCPEGEFPESFKKPKHLPFNDLICQEGKPDGAVDRTLDSKAFKGWTKIDNPWTNNDEADNGEMTYVSLQLNPERYTGYTTPSARRI
ncbi:endoplasmic reticulum oxidoreductin-1-like [Trifolium pratense]|nr:endoplasmic reticulum oxidoreductin-1-like [Trifolium pratense]XP_045789064.1 endoplasmic reticulum oxidoreductin-1-like [Trifolium pratense]XP_045789065.1 endoplasmic reticulum oxidoreductin-1-like [Trifolium pratense]